MKKRKLAGGTPGNGDVISTKGIYLDMQLGEATYSDICAEGRDPVNGCKSASGALLSCCLRGALIASELERCSLLYRGFAHEQFGLAVV